MYSWIMSILLALSNILGLSSSARDGVYCHRDGRNLKIFAGRTLPNGDLQFGLDKWEDDTNFHLFGIAKKVGNGWQYTEQDNEHIYDERTQQWVRYGAGYPLEATCQARIDWGRSGEVVVDVDRRRNCPDNAGYGFMWKSSRFSAGDFMTKVTFELDDSDSFFSARTADGC
jgi:hypothetical protein